MVELFSHPSTKSGLALSFAVLRECKQKVRTPRKSSERKLSKWRHNILCCSSLYTLHDSCSVCLGSQRVAQAHATSGLQWTMYPEQGSKHSTLPVDYNEQCILSRETSIRHLKSQRWGQGHCWLSKAYAIQTERTKCLAKTGWGSLSAKTDRRCLPSSLWCMLLCLLVRHSFSAVWFPGSHARG